MEQQDQRVTFAIAPMIDISNTHFRYFMRLLTARAVVYTEMLHHDAVLHSHAHLLPFNVQEHPVVLQLGGCDPEKLTQAAKLGEQYGYDQINLNVGCPSPRVQKGSFGACLMKEPMLVRECMQAMAKAVSIPCTVKCRLGVDEFDTFQFLVAFVKQVSGGGAGAIKHFVIHARKAILKGLNPAQNRSIPPLMYQRVYLLKKEFPELTFELNGGLKNIAMAKQLVDDHNLQGCMVGRLAYENPFELMTVDEIFYGEANYHTRYPTDAIARRDILIRYADYVEKLQEGKVKDGLGNVIRKPNPSVLVKPLINLYNGEKFNGRYRQYLSDLAKLKEGPLHLVIRKAAELMWEDGFRYKKKVIQETDLPSGQGQQQEQKQEVRAQKQEVRGQKQQKQVKQ